MVTAEDDVGLWRWREGADKMLESDPGEGKEHSGIVCMCGVGVQAPPSPHMTLRLEIFDYLYPTL